MTTDACLAKILYYKNSQIKRKKLLGTCKDNVYICTPQAGD